METLKIVRLNMKKIILFLLILCTLCSCSEHRHTRRTYEVTYEIIYPDKTIEYTDTFNIEMYPSSFDESRDFVYVYSCRGTNYISHRRQYSNMVSSTCPLRLISYKRLN